MSLRVLLAIISLFWVGVIHAQDEFEIDSLEEGSRQKFQIHIAPTYTATQFFNDIASFIGVSGGITFNDKIETSLYYGVISNDYKAQIIYPTIYAYEQKNIALNFQYFFTQNRVKPLIGAGVCYTQLNWRSEGSSQEVFTDYGFIYSLFGGFEWELNKTFAFQGSIGYSIAGEIDLVGLRREDFQGFRTDLAIKIDVLSF